MLPPHSYNIDSEEVGDGVMNSWYYHQQRRLLENGKSFEKGMGLRFKDNKKVGRGAVLGGIVAMAMTQFPSGLAIGGLVGAATSAFEQGVKVTDAMKVFDVDKSML